tara:strand:- start:184 stop:648 length:465 start_codon:yes stop_codon:yes gene_type:complete
MNKTKEIETQFIDKIDSKFPYSDVKLSKSLIEEAKSISPNAVFTIIEEIARISVSDRKKVSESQLKILLNQTTSNFEHPLLGHVLPTVVLMIENKEQTVDNAIILMNEIENYPGLWGALSLVYFSCDDVNGIADQKFDEIREKWNKKTTPQQGG